MDPVMLERVTVDPGPRSISMRKMMLTMRSLLAAVGVADATDHRARSIRQA